MGCSLILVNIFSRYWNKDLDIPDHLLTSSEMWSWILSCVQQITVGWIYGNQLSYVGTVPDRSELHRQCIQWKISFTNQLQEQKRIESSETLKNECGRWKSRPRREKIMSGRGDTKDMDTPPGVEGCLPKLTGIRIYAKNLTGIRCMWRYRF